MGWFKKAFGFSSKKFFSNPLNLLDPIGAIGKIKKEQAQAKQQRAMMSRIREEAQRREKALGELKKGHEQYLSSLDTLRTKQLANIEDVYSDMKRATIKQMLAYQGIRNMKKKGIGSDVELKLNMNVAQKIAAEKAGLQKRYELAKRIAQENYLKNRLAIETGSASLTVNQAIPLAANLAVDYYAQQLKDIGGGMFKVGSTLLGGSFGGMAGSQIGSDIGTRGGQALSGDVTTARRIEQMFSTMPKSYYDYYNSSDIFNRPLYNPQTGGIKAQSIDYGIFARIAET